MRACARVGGWIGWVWVVVCVCVMVFLSSPGHCCTLVYTSGTTGAPKGVMLSHDNLTWTLRRVISAPLYLCQLDRLVSYLPLSHIAAQMVDVHGACFDGCRFGCYLTPSRWLTCTVRGHTR
jgi:long-subunit acyl-CoA synthetase (AMP-forming)